MTSSPNRSGGLGGLLKQMRKMHGEIGSRRQFTENGSFSTNPSRRESRIIPPGDISIGGTDADYETESVTTESSVHPSPVRSVTESSNGSPSPSKPQVSQSIIDTSLYEFPVGTSVEACNLIEAKVLNGLRGMVVDDSRKDGRLVVDFGPPHGRRALRVTSLTAINLEHDLSIMFNGIAKWLRPVFEVQKVSPHQRRVVGSLARRDKRRWIVDLLSRVIYRPQQTTGQTASDAVKQVLDPTTKSHPHSDVFKIEKDLSDTKRIIIRFAKTDYVHDLEFHTATDRQRFYECVKAMRLDLLWCPSMVLGKQVQGLAQNNQIVGINGSTEVPIAGGTVGEMQRMSGQTKMKVSQYPTTEQSIWIGSLDIGDSLLTADTDFTDWLVPDGSDIVVIGLVGIPTDKETSRTKEKKEKDEEGYWSSFFNERLREMGYLAMLSTETSSSNKRNVVVLVFCKKGVAFHISNVSAWTGCHTRSYKGRSLLSKKQSVSTDLVSLSFTLRESPLCFICTSLRGVADGSSDEATAARNDVLQELLGKSEVGMPGGDSLLRFHHVFIFGNIGHGYKGATTPHSWKSLSSLPRGSDRLSREIALGQTLHGFSEGDLKMNDEMADNCLQQRVLWKSPTSMSSRPIRYCCYSVAGMNAVAAIFKFDVNLLFAEAFSKPTPRRSIILERCAARNLSKKLSQKSQIVCWSDFSDPPLLRGPDLRYDPANDEYLGSAIPAIEPITHSAPFIEKQYLILALKDKDTVIGAASLSLTTATANPGKPFSFELQLTRGAVEVPGKITGTVRINEDFTPVIEANKEWVEQITANIAKMMKEESMNRDQLIREEQMNCEPLSVMWEVSKAETETRFKERMLRIRTNCRATEREEEPHRRTILSTEDIEREGIWEERAIEKRQVILSEARKAAVNQETAHRQSILKLQEEAWHRLTWKQTQRQLLMEDENEIRLEINHDHRLLIYQLTDAAVNERKEIEFFLKELKEQNAADRQHLIDTEAECRIQIIREEDDELFQTEIQKIDNMTAARKHYEDRIQRELDSQQHAMAEEETARTALHRQELQEWSDLCDHRCSDLTSTVRDIISVLLTKEDDSRTNHILEEDMYWQNIVGEELSAWRIAARDAARLKSNKIFNPAKTALLSRNHSPTTLLELRKKKAEEKATKAAEEAKLNKSPDLGTVSPMQTPKQLFSELDATQPLPAKEEVVGTTSTEQQQQQQQQTAPTESELVGLLQAADEALERVGMQLSESVLRSRQSSKQPTETSAEVVVDKQRQVSLPPHERHICDAHDEVRELKQQLRAHQQEVESLRRSISSARLSEYEAQQVLLERSALRNHLSCQADDAARWRAAVALVEENASCPHCGIASQPSQVHSHNDVFDDASYLLNRSGNRQRLLTEALARVSRLKGESLSPVRGRNVGAGYQSTFRSTSPIHSTSIRGKCRAADTIRDQTHPD
eukprot:TRINITY_DN4984_c0_g1_i2.p1 TRINITY_DN4984_c0_g1~~TRINITY_DN4984_c0_g1_i2.p1  ORF type:complete len:1448 (+),score=326.65 TRINITY_DN4984_c0_g1_i2:1179-5522(+)